MQATLKKLAGGTKPRFVWTYSTPNEQLDRTPNYGKGFDNYPYIPWNADPLRSQNEDNDYPSQILRLFGRGGVAEYEAAKQFQARMIRGNGWVFESQDPRAIAQAKRLLNDKTLAAWAWDLAVFGAFASQEIYGFAIGQAEPVLQAIYPARVSQIRVGNPLPNSDGVMAPRWYFLAPDWTRLEWQGNGFRSDDGPAYLPTAMVAGHTQKEREDNAIALCERLRKDDDLTTLSLSALHYDFEYHPGSVWYPKPDIESALNEADVVSEATILHLASLRNGVFAGGVLNIPKAGIARQADGDLTPDEKIEQAEEMADIEQQLGGAGRAGLPLVHFYDPDAGELPIKFENAADSKNDARYLSAQKSSTNRILTSTGIVAPGLVGIIDGTGFASQADKLEMAYTIMEAVRTGPERKRILDYAADLMGRNGIDVKPNIEVSAPFKATTETTKIITQ